MSIEMEFPERISTISTIKLGSFGGDNIMYSVNIETSCGDNIAKYSRNNEFSNLRVGDEIKYIMNKIGGKTKLKSLIKIEKKMKKPLVSNLDRIPIQSLLFIDIETVRIEDKLTKGSDLYDSWAYKRRKEGETTLAALKKSYSEKAPLYPEFGKIVVITVGVVKGGEVIMKSFYDYDEKVLLSNFIKIFNKPSFKLCGWYIKNFDIPYIVNRLLINGIRIPEFLNTFDKKPWEVTNFLDLSDVWKGLFYQKTSLINTAVSLGLDSPKNNMDGSQVSEVYYKDEDGLSLIKEYCEKDVLCTVQIAQKLYNTDIITDISYKK